MAKRLGLNDLMEALGAEEFKNRIEKLVQEKDDAKPHLHPEDFSIREIYEACQLVEDVDPNMFPKITGYLISKKVMDAYLLVSKVADQLASTIPSNKEIETVSGFTGVGYMEKIKPGFPYPEHGMGEKYVTITNDKYGDTLNIPEETIIFDQTGKVLKRAGDLGDAAAQYQEELILNTIQDITGYKSYYPAGAQQDMWKASASGAILYPNLKASNALVDETDISNAKALFAAMKDDSPKLKPVQVRADTILVPVTLEDTAAKLFSSNVTLVSGHGHEPNIFKGRYKAISSAYLDVQSASTWYLGNFRKQYMWQEVIPLQVLRGLKGGDVEFSRDIVARYKVRFFGGCGAVDFRYVIQNTG